MRSCRCVAGLAEVVMVGVAFALVDGHFGPDSWLIDERGSKCGVVCAITQREKLAVRRGSRGTGVHRVGGVDDCGWVLGEAVAG